MDQLDQIFSNLAAQQQGRSKDMSTIFNEALSSVDNMQAPTMEPVPGTANPFGAMASAFAATLAEQFGAHGSMHANEARLAAQKEQQAAVEHSNFARQQAFDHEKQMQRIGILLKIGETKAKALDEQGDLEKFEAQIKANASLADKARKMQEDFDLKKMGLEHKNRLSEIAAAKKQTPEEKQAALDMADDKLVLQFQEQIENVGKMPGNTAKTPAQKAMDFGLFKVGSDTPETISLSPAGVDAILSRSAAAARSVKSSRVSRVALETYFEVAKNSGRIVPGKRTPALETLVALANKVITDDEEYNQWMKERGLAK